MRKFVCLIPLCLAVVVMACADPVASPAAPSALVSSEGAAAKPAPNTTLIPATVTFLDRSGDAITSDGGPYVNAGRLTVGFYTASRDLVLKGAGRALNLNYGTRAGDTGPAGTTLVSDIFLNIHGILDMAPNGGSRVTTAAVKRTSIEFFRFNDSTYAGSTKVNVVRDVSGVWTVTADSAIAALIGNKNSTLGLYAMPFQLTAVCSSCS